MSVPITVLTPTIPGRTGLLARNIDSVYGQTLKVETQLVHCQPPVPGMNGTQHCAIMLNELLTAVKTEFVLILHDDNYLLPFHVEELWPYCENADFVYSWDASHNRNRYNMNGFSGELVQQTFAQHNPVDASGVIIRTQLLRICGGWPTEWEGDHWKAGGHFAGMRQNTEDWAIHYRLAVAHARFVCVPWPTWVYGLEPTDRISEEVPQ